MGSPLFGQIAEIFLQHYEVKNIKHLLDTKNIAFYTRYIDDILIIFDTTKIDSHTINAYINNIHNNLKLNPTYEEHDSIDYLDLKILRKHKKLEVDIYMKQTSTDTTINFLSNHPIEQKTAAYRFHTTRMQSLPLDKKKQTKQSIARNNSFPQHLLHKLNQQIHNKTDHTQ
jgi:HJR/Mrr/RecB family endonuclease